MFRLSLLNLLLLFSCATATLLGCFRSLGNRIWILTKCFPEKEPFSPGKNEPTLEPLFASLSQPNIQFKSPARDKLAPVSGDGHTKRFFGPFFGLKKNSEVVFVQRSRLSFLDKYVKGGASGICTSKISGDKFTALPVENSLQKKEFRKITGLMSFLKHPNIFLPADCFPEEFVRVMEIPDIGNAQENLLMCFLLSSESQRSLERDLGSAVQHLHSRQIAHREICLSNVLLFSSGADGIAPKLTCPERIYPGRKYYHVFQGSEEYRPPEATKAKALCRESLPAYPADVWCLGVCWYAFSHGSLPKREDSELLKCAPWCTRKFKKLIGGMMEVEPDLRLSIHEVMECHVLY